MKAQDLIDEICGGPESDESKRRVLAYRFPHPDSCAECAEQHRMGETFAPSHDGSSRCESGSIASGGTRSHCTCDCCF